MLCLLMFTQTQGICLIRTHKMASIYSSIKCKEFLGSGWLGPRVMLNFPLQDWKLVFLVVVLSWRMHLAQHPVTCSAQVRLQWQECCDITRIQKSKYLIVCKLLRGKPPKLLKSRSSCFCFYLRGHMALICVFSCVFGVL